MELSRQRSERGGIRCSVCKSPRLHELSGAIACGMTQREAAAKFGFSQQVISQHCKKHMRPLLTAHDVLSPVLTQVRRINARTMAILDQVESTCNWSVALQAINTARQNLELISRLTGEMKNAPVEDVKVEIVYGSNDT
jgi:hypothetical protein